MKGLKKFNIPHLHIDTITLKLSHYNHIQSADMKYNMKASIMKSKPILKSSQQIHQS